MCVGTGSGVCTVRIMLGAGCAARHEMQPDRVCVLCAGCCVGVCVVWAKIAGAHGTICAVWVCGCRIRPNVPCGC